MSRINTGSTSFVGTTHEGGPARVITPLQELRRSVLACLLWEQNFYESGQTISERIASLVPQCEPHEVAALAVEARSNMHLRHAPLFLVREMARHASHRPLVRATLSTVIQRADELAEFLAIYWKDKKQPLAKSVQRGLADAFQKFNAYQLAKYNRDNSVKLRDVLFLSHAKPKPTVISYFETVKGKRRDLAGQGLDWKQLVEGTLPTPDTWEVAISATKGQKQLAHDEWTRLLTENKLGPMALMRNLRNMTEAGVSDMLIRAALTSMKPDRVLPFRFIAAARIMPRFVSELDGAMMQNLAGQDKIPGMTFVLIDVSGSMDVPLSAKSDMKRTDAAAGLGVIARELCQTARVFTFSNHVVEVSPYRGLALVEAVQRSQPHSGTNLGAAVERLNKEKYDRLIVITDEQSHDRVGGPNGMGYLINVASNKSGVGYGPWFHIDGFSERVMDYIRETASGISN